MLDISTAQLTRELTLSHITVNTFMTIPTTINHRLTMIPSMTTTVLVTMMLLQSITHQLMPITILVYMIFSPDTRPGDMMLDMMDTDGDQTDTTLSMRLKATP